jgi:histidine triad (HIT) family protein
MQPKLDCVFCQIVAGRAPAFRICEDELTCSFLDIFPVEPGHTLIVTKRHFRDLFETDAESLEAVARTSLRVSAGIEAALAPAGLGVYQLNREAAGQTVFHYHMHLLPRSAGSSFKLHARIRGNDDELAAMADRLRAALPV